MTPGSVARRYGKALFELATETGEVDAVGVGLTELATAVSGLDEGSLAPGLLSEEQRQHLAKALVLRVGGDSLIGRFLAVLASNDRLDQLPRIRETYEKLEDAAAGRVRVRIRSASALPDDQRGELKRKFEAVTGRKIVDTAELDPGLLGGVTVEAEGRVYDGSVRTQLARLERRMAGQTG